MSSRLPAVSALTVVAVAAVVVAPGSHSGAPGSIYWGARVGQQFTGTMPPWDLGAQARFERIAGKGASLIHWGAPFMSPAGDLYRFDRSAAENARRHGALSVYDWAPYQDGQGADQPRFSLSTVIAGDWDAYMTAWFRSVKAWGHPIFLRFAWEMNDPSFPWGVGVNGNTPAEYVAAWRHVHAIATRAGARNVTWVWCPNAVPLAGLAAYYPGNTYVDWTCLDGYNWGTDPNGDDSGWRSFDQVFGAAYRAVLALAPTKPVMIGEVGSTEDGGSKADWIANMLRRLPSAYPRVRAVLWFDQVSGGVDWRIESSNAARQAFAAGIQESPYAANHFASLRTSPIPAP